VTSTWPQSGTERVRVPPTAPEPDRVERVYTYADTVAADPVGEAVRTWMRACALAGWATVVGSETVAVTAARGRVTAEPVRARLPVPAYRAAAMDGIAVSTRGIAAQTGDEPGTIRLPPEQFDLVDTGDPVPEGRDAVVMREHVTFTPDGAAEISGPAVAGRHIRSVGEDIDAGAIVLPAGHRVRPVDAAALAAAGHTSILVRRRPVVAILPTGDEIRPVGATLAPGEILDTNSIMLSGLAEDAGCRVETLPIAPDAPDHIAVAVATAARTADLVLIVAGSSVGRDDHTASVIRRLGRVAVHGVAMRPGHPVVLGVLAGIEKHTGSREVAADRPEVAGLCVRPGAPAVPVVGIPGYPASAERAFTCFVRPLLHRILDTGAPRVAEHGLAARLASAVVSAEHLDEYVRVRLARVFVPRTGQFTLVAVPLSRGAGALTALAQTEAILRIPAGTNGYPAGTTVRPAAVDGAAFAAYTTIVTGLVSPATATLVQLLGADRPVSAMHWQNRTADAAVEALAEGLCHAAALTISFIAGRPDEQMAAALVDRLGPITLLELARTGARAEVLVVPAAAFDSIPIKELRTVLNSIAYRRALHAVPAYTGRGAGHETWHGPAEDPEDTTHTFSSAPVNGATQCATR
jgi:putative molybdopterin biosynthesis protein